MYKEVKKMIKNSMKVNLTLNKDLVESYDVLAREMCVPRSALLNIVLTQYIENKLALNSMSGLEGLVAKMENMKESDKS
jgi:metal-responsive CopG/Arc/MetJ family transcriptional regulator